MGLTMNIESIYLTTEKGLTTTSANHLSNLAKEVLKNAEYKLKHISFITENVELINGDKKLLEKGVESCDNIDGLIKQIGKMHSFIAWMREAIKTKELLASKVNKITLEEYCEENNLEIPKCPEEFCVTATTVINEMNVKERQRYLTLEAYAAAYGQYIHPDGEIAEARDRMYDLVNNPARTSGSGRDTIIYIYEPSIDPKIVENTFLQLQATHRSYEQQLNAIKFKINEEVNRRNAENSRAYREKYEEYAKIMQILRAKKNEYVINLSEQISKLKIVVPNDLTDTFEYLNSLG